MRKIISFSEYNCVHIISLKNAPERWQSFIVGFRISGEPRGMSKGCRSLYYHVHDKTSGSASSGDSMYLASGYHNFAVLRTTYRYG